MAQDLRHYSRYGVRRIHICLTIGSGSLNISHPDHGIIFDKSLLRAGLQGGDNGAAVYVFQIIFFIVKGVEPLDPADGIIKLIHYLRIFPGNGKIGSGLSHLGPHDKGIVPFRHLGDGGGDDGVHIAGAQGIPQGGLGLNGDGGALNPLAAAKFRKDIGQVAAGGNADGLAVKGRGNAGGNYRLSRVGINIVFLHPAGKGAEKKLALPQGGFCHSGHQLDFPPAELGQQDFKVPVDILILPVCMVGNFLKIFVAVAGFCLAVPSLLKARPHEIAHPDDPAGGQSRPVSRQQGQGHKGKDGKSQSREFFQSSHHLSQHIPLGNTGYCNLAVSLPYVGARCNRLLKYIITAAVNLSPAAAPPFQLLSIFSRWV